MKFVKKVLFIFIIFSAIICLNINIVNADVNSMGSDASNFITKGGNEASGVISTITDSIVPEVKSLASLLTVIGVGVLICVTTYLGIQYFISPPDKQGALKEKLIAILVAAVIIFGAYNIWKIVLNIVKNFD